jgi:hypothetical protein
MKTWMILFFANYFNWSLVYLNSQFEQSLCQSRLSTVDYVLFLVASATTAECVLIWTAAYIVSRILGSVCWMFVYTETCLAQSWSPGIHLYGNVLCTELFPRNGLHVTLRSIGWCDDKWIIFLKRLWRKWSWLNGSTFPALTLRSVDVLLRYAVCWICWFSQRNFRRQRLFFLQL